MEYKDPMHELLSSLEQIVSRDETQKITLMHRTTSYTETEQLREGAGLKIDDFAQVSSVLVAMVREQESRRVKPSSTELELMRLIQANLALSKQLMEWTFIHFIAIYGPDGRTAFQPIDHKYRKQLLHHSPMRDLMHINGLTYRPLKQCSKTSPFKSYCRYPSQCIFL